MDNILKDFAAAVSRHPDRTAIVDGKGREISFRQLSARAEGFAQSWQKSGIRKGDRVLLAMKLDADLYAALAALWSLGATVILPEPAMGLAGLRHAAKVSNVSAFCSSGIYGLLKFALPELWPLRHLRPRVTNERPHDRVPPDDDDIALISFTSGTTGAPKAIPRSHGFLAAQHQAIAPLLSSASPERDLVAFPVFVLINIASGQTSILPRWKMSRLAKLRPDTLEQWEISQNVSRVLLPPSICEILATTHIPDTLHTVFTGGGPVFPDILDKLKSGKPNLRIVCVYGSTEAEPIAHLDAAEITADDHTKMMTGQGLLVGHPVDAIRVRIANDEILVAGAHVNSGYLDPSHNADNKILEGTTVWHRTGDAGYFDNLGRLWLLGRIGSQVITKDGHIFPFTIETAARSWDGVKQCALISQNGAPTLVIEGDTTHMKSWKEMANRLRVPIVIPFAKIPMDKRHGSKIDRMALQKLLPAGR